LLHGRVATGGTGADLYAIYDDDVVIAIDLLNRSVRHVEPGGTVVSIEPGFDRLTTHAGAIGIADLLGRARPGWPSLQGRLGVPMTPWLEPLEQVLAGVAGLPEPLRGRARNLLTLRAHDALRDALASASPAVDPELVHAAVELARTDDPPRTSRAG
jgi:hypothetical protein